MVDAKQEDSTTILRYSCGPCSPPLLQVLMPLLCSRYVYDFLKHSSPFKDHPHIVLAVSCPADVRSFLGSDVLNASVRYFVIKMENGSFR